jgi:isoquinoline 1-oxidoreductase
MSANDVRSPRAEPERYELEAEAPYRFALGRRDMLKLVGGGVVVGVLLDPAARAQESGRAGRGSDDGPQDVSAWVHVDENGAVSVFTGKAELGQNIRTSLSQAVADELRVPLESVALVMADTERTPFDAGTFGSRTTPQMAPQLRRAAAAARMAILDVAAARWGVDASALETKDGRVRDPKGGREASYGEITRGERIARVIDAATAPLDRSAWRLAGTPVHKVDGRAFVTGAHAYTSDVTRPGLLHGAIVRPPAFGAQLKDADIAATSHIAGARVVRDGDFLGVVAPDIREARRAASLVRATWATSPPIAGRDLYEVLRRTADKDDEAQVQAAGSIDEGRRAATRTLTATYTVPYIAHVPLEPRAAVAEWTGDRLTVWTGTQRPFGVQRELSEAFRLPIEQVRVIVPDTGSAYGGKHTGETALEAARLARAAGKPVKVAWTRVEEFTWAYFRPAGVIDVAAGLTPANRIAFWTFDNYNSGASAIRTPYQIPHQRTAFHRSQSPLRQGSYRGLAATANQFARECHMDELAHMASVDPVKFRLDHLEDARIERVLTETADRIGWGAPKPGEHLGIACGTEKGGYVATAVALVVEDGRIRLRRIVCAFDCGASVNPDGLRNQIEGAVVQGLGGALFEAIEFDRGRILNASMGRYRVPRFADVPAIDVIVVEPPGAPSAGAGETPLIAVAPAIAGALFKATGTRARALPLGTRNEAGA